MGPTSMNKQCSSWSDAAKRGVWSGFTLFCHSYNTHFRHTNKDVKWDLRSCCLMLVAAVKRLPVLHHSAVYIFVCFVIIESSMVTLKIDTTSTCARGHMQSRKLHCCIWRILIKPNLRFSFFFVFFVSKGNRLEFCIIQILKQVW